MNTSETAYNALSGAIDALFWILINGSVAFVIWTVVKRFRRGSVIEYEDVIDTTKFENPPLKMGVYAPAAGWLTDPNGTADKRYWDGDVWTNRVKGRKRSNASKGRTKSSDVAGSSSDLTRNVDAHSKLDDVGIQFRLIAQLHADGLLTDLEYENKKQELLKRI